MSRTDIDWDGTISEGMVELSKCCSVPIVEEPFDAEIFITCGKCGKECEVVEVCEDCLGTGKYVFTDEDNESIKRCKCQF